MKIKFWIGLLLLVLNVWGNSPQKYHQAFKKQEGTVLVLIAELEENPLQNRSSKVKFIRSWGYNVPYVGFSEIDLSGLISKDDKYFRVLENACTFGAMYWKINNPKSRDVKAYKENGITGLIKTYQSLKKRNFYSNQVLEQLVKDYESDNIDQQLALIDFQQYKDPIGNEIKSFDYSLELDYLKNEGNTIDQLKGKTFVIYFIKMNCPHCTKGIKGVKEVASANSLPLVVIASKSSPISLDKELLNFDVKTIARDNQSSFKSLYGGNSVPVVMVVFGDGTANRQVGTRDLNKLVEK